MLLQREWTSVTRPARAQTLSTWTACPTCPSSPLRWPPSPSRPRDRFSSSLSRYRSHHQAVEANFFTQHMLPTSCTTHKARHTPQAYPKTYISNIPYPTVYVTNNLPCYMQITLTQFMLNSKYSMLDQDVLKANFGLSKC